jgi:toxin ParE1/3/4
VVIKGPQAEHDLDEQATYLQQDSPRVAIRFLEQAEKTFNALDGMPGMGTPYGSDHPRLLELRCFRVSGFKNHLVFYRPIEDGIEIVRVLHGARDIRSILERELLDPTL